MFSKLYQPIRKNVRFYNKLMYLINPRINTDFSTYSNDGSFPPLGLLAVGTQAKLTTDWQVKVFDAEITHPDDILKQMKIDRPQVVGLSILADTYNSGLIFAREAKKIGATTLMGNDQASLLGSNILKKQEIIDHICSAEYGEIFVTPYLNYMDGKIPIDDVPFLYYRKNGLVEMTKVQEVKLEGKYKLDRFPTPDRTLLPQSVWDTYARNYMKTYGHLHDTPVKGVTTINRGRGCSRGNGNGRCSYCGIFDLSIKTASPNKLWEDVEQAHNDVQADVFYEVFDSMSSVPNWVQEVINARPVHLKDKKFFVYAQAKEVTPTIIKLYKDLNVFMVNMGLDSGDDVMLKRLKGKKDSIEANRRALTLIKGAGMTSFCSLVLGALGENRKSVQNTIDFAKWIVDNNLACSIEANVLMPRKGSLIGGLFDSPNKAELKMFEYNLEIKNMKLFKETVPCWQDEDIVDTPKMSDIYARCFTDIGGDNPYQFLIDAANEITNYAKQAGLGNGSVGIKKDYVSSVQV